MPLFEELQDSGNWLFRWRSYLPLALIVPMLLAMYRFDYVGHRHIYQEIWAFLCFGISLFGLGIRALVVGYAPNGTSGRNTSAGQVANSLNTTGMYSIVRHPLYLANFIIWIGISLFCLTWWLTTIFLLIYWLYYERIMIAEEEFLRAKFGDEYVRWADNTPPFVPRLTQWQPASLPFSWRNVMRREYSGLLAIVLAFCGLEFLEHVVKEHTVYLEPQWIVVLVLGATTYVCLRTLKKKTSLLSVPGRC